MDSREWVIIAGLVSLMAGTGCSHEQVSQAKPQVSSVASPAQVAQSEVATSAAEADKPFVHNENLQPVYFELSKSQLDDKAMVALQKNAEWLKQNTSTMVQVEGYSDTRGSARKNRWVAERRAVQVREYYVSLGIPKNRILIKGMGPEESACAALTEECLAESRRSDTLIENKTLTPKS